MPCLVINGTPFHNPQPKHNLSLQLYTLNRPQIHNNTPSSTLHSPSLQLWYHSCESHVSVIWAAHSFNCTSYHIIWCSSFEVD
ncbi:hypothetical protein M758_3G112700 [Ceratodon purpureus]|nr:hypothetical protein M758_3G112700 [Ceratodon purpureus]